MIKPAPQAITNLSTLGELEARVQARASANPRFQQPQLLTAPLSLIAMELGPVAEACDRQFTAAGDRTLVAEKIGHSLLVLTLVAQASGTPLAKCIETYRASLRRPRSSEPLPA